MGEERNIWRDMHIYIYGHDKHVTVVLDQNTKPDTTYFKKKNKDIKIPKGLCCSSGQNALGAVLNPAIINFDPRESSVWGMF